MAIGETGSIGLSNMVQNFLVGKQMRQQQQEQNQMRQLFGQMLTGQGTGEQLATLNPELYLKGQEFVQGRQAAKAQAQRVMEEKRDIADVTALIAASPERQSQILQQRVQDIQSMGGDASDSIALLQMQPEERGRYLGMMASQLGIKVPESKTEFKKLNDYSLFNAQTGEVKIDEGLKAKLAKDAQEVDVKTIRDINSDIEGITKEAKNIYQSAKDLEVLGQEATASDQLGIIFKFMKSLDPGSVVREGEQVMLQKSGGLFDYMSNYINRLNTGKTLSPKMIQEIVTTAQKLANSNAANAEKAVSDYLSLYDEKLSPEMIQKYRKQIPGTFEITQMPNEDISIDDLMSRYGVTQ